MTLNWIAIGLATLLTWALGALWYGPIFGKLWMRIHHGAKAFTKDEMEKAMKGMWKLMVTELTTRLLTIIGLACLILAIPQYPWYQTAFMVWIGFLAPLTVSNIIWGGDDKKMIPRKIAVMISYQLIAILLAGFVISKF